MSTDLPHDRSVPFRPQSVAARPASSGVLPRWGWMLLLVYVCVVATIRSLDTIDGAIVNILTLVCTFLTCLPLFIWFCFFSNYPATARKTVLIVLPGTIALLLALFRIDGVAGTLIPELRFRWQRMPDQLLAAPALPPARSTAEPASSVSDDSGPSPAAENKSTTDETSGRVDLTKTTPDDFPQFLGPQRSGWLPEPALDSDWSRHAPKLLWRNPIGAGWSAFSVVNGFAVTLEQRGEDELVVCYEALSGKPVWAHTEKTRHCTVLGGVGTAQHANDCWRQGLCARRDRHSQLP